MCIVLVKVKAIVLEELKICLFKIKEMIMVEVFLCLDVIVLVGFGLFCSKMVDVVI